MGIFDPQPAKTKPIKRPIYKFPETLNRKLFLLIYLVSLFFWIMAIGLIGGLIFFILLPMIFNSIPLIYAWIAIFVFAIIGAIIGSLMGSMVINAIIQEGVKAGEIELG
jgi:hypothetical protein